MWKINAIDWIEYHLDDLDVGETNKHEAAVWSQKIHFCIKSTCLPGGKVLPTQYKMKL